MVLYGSPFNLLQWGCPSKIFCQPLLSILKQIITSKISTISKISRTSGKILPTLRNGITKPVASATTTKKARQWWSRSIAMTTIMTGNLFAVLRPQSSTATSLMTGKTSLLTGISMITSKSKANWSLKRKGTTTLMWNKSSKAVFNTPSCLMATKEKSPLTPTTIKIKSSTELRSSLASTPSHSSTSTTWVPGRSTKIRSLRPPIWFSKRLLAEKRSTCLLWTRQCLKSSCHHAW